MPIHQATLSFNGGVLVDYLVYRNDFGKHAASGTVTAGTSLTVNGSANIAGDTTLVGTTIATGKVTANEQPPLSALGDNDVYAYVKYEKLPS